YKHLGQFAPLGGEQTAAQLPGDWVSIGQSSQWLWYSVYARKISVSIPDSLNNASRLSAGISISGMPPDVNFSCQIIIVTLLLKLCWNEL
ncbi:NAD(P)H dehydrogenase B3 mitochondrial-like, partial [Trifolium medium]|nr:NAD(P)H dehydrogenase B3 mitochondrial-like [Trifolium medium]